MINQSFDRQIENAEKAGRGKGIRELTQISESSPEFALAIAVENLKKDLMASERQENMDNRPTEVPPDVIGRNEQELMNMLSGAPQQPQPQPQLQQQEQGLPQIPANNMAMPMAAQGGIVGYANGGDVEEGWVGRLGQQLGDLGRGGVDLWKDASQWQLDHLQKLGRGIAGIGQGVGEEWRRVNEQPEIEAMKSLGQFAGEYFGDMRDRYKEWEGERNTPDNVGKTAQGYADATAGIDSALLPETETFLEAIEILENPESTDEQKAFARMQLEGLKDAPMRAEMLQQVDKIRAARRGMAGGGIVSLAPGGLVEVGDTTEEGEVIVAMLGNVPVTQVEYDSWLAGSPLPANRNAVPTLAPPLTPEQIAQKRVDQINQAVGPLIGGDTGLWQDLKDVGSDPNLTTWQQRAGGGLEVGAEAASKFLAKVLGGTGAGLEYIARSGMDIGEGAAQTGALGEGVETIGEGLGSLTGPSLEQRQQLEDAFNAQLAALSAQLNELENTPINFDIDPNGEQRAAAVAALQGQRDRLQAQYESAVAELPSRTRSVREIPASISNFLQRYEDDPTSTWLGRTMEDIFGDARTTTQPAPGETGPHPLTAADMINNPDLYTQAVQAQGGAALDQKQAAFNNLLQQMAAAQDGDVVEEVVDPVDPEGSSWVDKLVDVGILLGGGAGASKGHEFAAITEAAAQRRAVEDAQEFDMAKQQALLNQRTEEYEARAAQLASIAKAEALLDLRPALVLEIQNSDARKIKERELMDTPEINRGWLLPRNQEALDAALAEWDVEQLKLKMAEMGEYFNDATNTIERVPSTTTVTEGFGEVTETE